MLGWGYKGDWGIVKENWAQKQVWTYQFVYAELSIWTIFKICTKRICTEAVWLFPHSQRCDNPSPRKLEQFLYTAQMRKSS